MTYYKEASSFIAAIKACELRERLLKIKERISDFLYKFFNN